jgi:hypothetical protein
MNKITCEDFEDQIEYLFSRLEGEDSCTIICDREIAREISNLYDEDEFENLYSIELSTEDNVYIIGKIKDEIFCIEPAFNASGRLLGFDEENIILVQKELYKEDIKEYLEDFDNVVIIGLEDTEEERECKDCCEGCISNCCYNDTEDEGLGEEIEEFLTEVIKDYYNDEIDLRTLARIVYSIGFEDAEKETLLSIKQSFNRAIDEALED